MKSSCFKALEYSVLLFLFLHSQVSPAVSQSPSNPQDPIKIGLIIPTSGVVAAPGLQMKKGWELWLKQNGQTVAGRTIETFIENTAGDPSTGRLKARRLVEQQGVDVLVGPVLANVGLAIADYVKDKDVLLALPVVAANNVTQRERQWNVLKVAGWSSSQVTHPMGEWAFKQAYKRGITIGNDYNFGHQNVGGFANTFTDDGGRIIKQIWNPLGTNDFSPYLSRIISLRPDVVFAAQVGSDAVRFINQWQGFGLKGRIPLLGNPTLLKQSTLNHVGDEVLGLKAVTRYSAARKSPANQQFVQAFDQEYGELPDATAASTYTAGKWLTKAIESVDGEFDDIHQLINAVKNTTLRTSPLGSMKMDEYGNPIIDVYLVETVKRDDGRKWNKVLKTWENVSQFWTYGPDEFLQQPVYSRDFQGGVTGQFEQNWYLSLQLLNGLTFASLLFLVTSGFTLIFGLMQIINLAHGAFYLLGGYLGLTVIQWTGSFWLGVCAGALLIGLVGLIIDRFLISVVRGNELAEVLLTMGVAFVISDLSLIIWGGETLSIPTPAVLEGSVEFAGIVFPVYRLFLVVLAGLVAVLLGYLHNYTRYGAILQAGVDDPEMTQSLGINVYLVFTAVFFLGAALTGFAGVAGGAYLNLYPGADMEILLYALVVVAIGGLGSLRGALVGSLLVGFLDTFGKVFLPELAYFTLFGPMVLILAFRPRGLFGRSER